MRVVNGIILVLLLGACRTTKVTSEQRFSFSDFIMATEVRLVLYAPSEARARAAAQHAFSRMRELNGVFSDYDANSEVSRLSGAAGKGTWTPVSPDLWIVTRLARELGTASDGALDITVGRQVLLWRQAHMGGRMPKPERLEKARALSGWNLVEFDPAQRAIRLREAGMRLDFGAIAKGYAADEALRVMAGQGVVSALVDIGGDLVLGEPPPGKAGWVVAVEGGRRLELARCGVATSGKANRFIAIDGVRYSHIVDPRTGLGLTHDLQVTVQAKDGLHADALATACSVLGEEKSRALLEAQDAKAWFKDRLGHGR